MLARDVIDAVLQVNRIASSVFLSKVGRLKPLQPCGI